MIRIAGIVKTADRVKKQLQQGINPQEIDNFKTFIIQSLKAIENICKEARTTPNNLPTPSRKAYYYLKQIDLQNLPINTQQKVITPVQTLKIKNIISQQKNIQQQIERLKECDTNRDRELIFKTISDYVGEIESICQKNNVTPGALATPSRKAYAWMKFLTDRHNFNLHLDTIREIESIWQKTLQEQKIGDLQLKIELTNYRGLYKYKQNRHQHIELILSEGFIKAEEQIIQAMINSLISKNTPKDKQLIRQFSLTEEYKDVILELDLIAELDADIFQGNYYNLEYLFEEINRDYFASKMVKPRLTWNQTLTHRKLGHYEPLRNLIVISRTLDSPQVPKIVVELVLYHELLHKHHGIKWVKGKRMVHTREFRHDERRFKHYLEAQKWLEKYLIQSM